jgi:hypothetical protein
MGVVGVVGLHYERGRSRYCYCVSFRSINDRDLSSLGTSPWHKVDGRVHN